jgi:hypothetical protein
MKQIARLLFIFLFLLLNSSISKAQLVNGSIAPDFTLTDIKGQSHNLYNYLSQGKTVFLDFSATWCHPCWNYHVAHHLEDLWEHHGPVGGKDVDTNTTDDVMVLFIEPDLRTDTNDLKSATSMSVGDWVTGTPYPIIDLMNNTVSAAYGVAYYPTIFMICPDKICRQIGPRSYPDLYTKYKSDNCFSAVAGDDVGIMNSDFLNYNRATCDSVAPEFRICNYGTNNLTSAAIELKIGSTVQKTYNWTGNLAPFAHQQLNIGNIGGVGKHEVTVKVSLPNGVADMVAGNDSAIYTINVLSASVQDTAPLTEGFESGVPPTNWIVDTAGGKAIAWKITNIGHNSSKSVFLKMSDADIYEKKVVDMYLPTLSTMGLNYLQLDFDVAAARLSSQFGQDSLQIFVSDDCGSSWIKLWGKGGSTLSTQVGNRVGPFVPTSNEWRNEKVNLSNYLNKSALLIKFRGTNKSYTSANNIYVDNINLSTSPNSIINFSKDDENIIIYPNPGSDQLSLTVLDRITNGKYKIFDTNGKCILEGEIEGMNKETIDINDLAEGLYFVKVEVGGHLYYKKFVKVKSAY